MKKLEKISRPGCPVVTQYCTSLYLYSSLFYTRCRYRMAPKIHTGLNLSDSPDSSSGRPSAEIVLEFYIWGLGTEQEYIGLSYRPARLHIGWRNRSELIRSKNTVSGFGGVEQRALSYDFYCVKRNTIISIERTVQYFF